MSRKEEYRQYLQSDTWKKKRDRVFERSNGRCEYCHEIATAVHHVKYPKALGTEHEKDLVATCERCHDLNHGRGMMDTLTSAALIERVSPSGLRFRALKSNGRVYARSISWAAAVGWPKGEIARFEALLDNQARKRPSWVANYQGETVYRWHAVEDALQSFYWSYRESGFKTRNLGLIEQQQYDNLFKNYDAIREWGRDLQEREIAGVVSSGMDVAPSASPTELIARALQMLAPKVEQHDAALIEHKAVLVEHEERLTAIAKQIPIERDREAWVPVKQAIYELGLDPTILPVPGLKWNLAQVAGQRLIESGVNIGPPIWCRMEDSKKVISVNTYRRGSVYDILLSLVDESTKH